ncbi:hypothetical protein QQS21_012726 [Conoideocrella luteorostrata]|uniref:Uncharacterized protein n=1 Tax=Conoideocrella luteorostrata TaxID=1105319 RepID=A0AAJ0CAN3_9HYPO|nr:hypothetical protein QQS21_012726 [Conoideocrella luteorostrata]
MRAIGFGTVSRRIRAEKALKHIGTAQVEVNVLCFPDSNGPDNENVKRLKSLFRMQHDLDPEEPQNRIPAVIDETDLHEALATSGLSQDSLLSNSQNYAKLNFRADYRLKCLRGEDRIEAAKQAFRSSALRWIVDLFAADISNEAQRDIVEEYSSERKLDDGEIYYKIREYQGICGQEHPHFERRWWARLATLPDSKRKKECLDQLLGHRKFSRAFDAFYPIPALYCGLRLSVVSKMISTRCHEVSIKRASNEELVANSQELLAYLRHIKDFWYSIFDGEESAMQRLDKESVLALELKAPGACQKDTLDLYGRVHGGEILCTFSQMERERIWSRICSATTECLIPSLRGFFNNLNYIKLGADCMKRLVSLQSKETIRGALESAYEGTETSSGECLVQVSGQSTKLVQTNRTEHFDIYYRQLWLYALREHPAIPAEVRAKKSGGKTTQVDENVLFRFARFAHKLGFRSDEISELLRSNPDRAIARRLLTTARRPEEFNYEDMESCITAVEDVIASARPVSNDGAEYVIEHDEKPPERSGQPAKNDLARDKRFMYLDVFHGAFQKQDLLTSLFIQRSMYFAFFGKDIDVSVDDINGAPELQEAMWGSIAFEQHSNRHLICDEGRSTQLSTVQHTTEEGYQRQLEDLRGKLAETESRLEPLVQKENEHLNNIERLQSTLTIQQSTLGTLKCEDRDLREKLAGLRQKEAEQIIRLETLQNDVQERQSQIGELVKRRNDLGEEIRLDLVTPDRQNQSTQEDQEVMLLELSQQAIEKQNSVNQLAALNREKQQEARYLEDERQRLQVLVDGLIAKNEEEQTRAATLAAEEKERNSTVDKLREKELELRRTIDHLDTCLQRLQTKINDAREVEKELQLRIERLVEKEWADEAASEREYSRTNEPLAERAPMENSTLGTMVRRALNPDEESMTEGSIEERTPVTRGPTVAAGTGQLVHTPQELLEPGMVRVQFKLFENGDWRLGDEVVVDPNEPSTVMRLAKKNVF